MPANVEIATEQEVYRNFLSFCAWIEVHEHSFCLFACALLFRNLGKIKTTLNYAMPALPALSALS